MLENTTIILIIGAAWVFFLLNIIIFHFFGKRRSLLSLVNGQNSENWILMKILRAVLKSENLSCIAVDAEGKISLVNPAAKKIFNNALKGRHYEEVFPETTGLNDLIGRVLIGGESFYEEIKINLEEKDYFLHIIFEAVKDRHGKTSGAVLFFKDITEEKARELADREEEKLTAVKQLAAGVAHEMRQPLTVIKGFAQLLQKEVGDSVKLNSFCRVIVNEMDRMNEIIADFIELATPPVCLHRKFH
ncbi:MAG TPA: hypothetical protein DEA47_02490 [Peptococcaceae bacterium]|nr:MAG: Multi-sensor signal transduction histidine kinase [Clostridia bacterium 41_269]HBT20228.1 hypothetical protein [Peptococcaceae bacterium]